MSKSQKKCSLYIRPNNKDGSIEYTVTPKPTSVVEVDGVVRYDFNVKVDNPGLIRIVVSSRLGAESHLTVEKIVYNNQPIDNINSVGFLKPKNGEVRRTYGYIDCEGEYIVKLHTNPVSLNYLNYLLELTKSK